MYLMLIHLLCRFMRRGTLLQQYAQVLAIILRLRQICVHQGLLNKAALAAAAAIGKTYSIIFPVSKFYTSEWVQTCISTGAQLIKLRQKYLRHAPDLVKCVQLSTIPIKIHPSLVSLDTLPYIFS